MAQKEKLFKLILRGKTGVFVDWSNVYNWKKSLKWEVDPRKLFSYLTSYQEVEEIRFYFGTDPNPKSKQQLLEAREIGYKTVTKPVKLLPVLENNKIVWRRKCDFDLEIGLDAFEKLKEFKTFIFFSGDGDFATLYERLAKLGKQVIVIYTYGHLGKEIWQLKKGIFKASIIKLGADFKKKMTPNRRSGAQLKEVYSQNQNLSIGKKMRKGVKLGYG